MRIINWIAITFFGFSLITAVALGLISRDYEFVPGSQESERSNNQTGQIEIPGEVISKFLRTSGNLDPGNVEVQVLFLNPIQNIEDDKLIFQVTLNTHSVNLAGYDITKKAVLEDSNGRTITEGFYWKQIHNNKGHHLMGILVFPAQATEQNNGNTATVGAVEWIKLTIKGLPGTENREFQWDIELS